MVSIYPSDIDKLPSSIASTRLTLPRGEAVSLLTIKKTGHAALHIPHFEHSFISSINTTKPQFLYNNYRLTTIIQNHISFS
jgi:hypothetical protein